jgi:transcriptional regulator with XRE-family HTH domain
MSDTVYNKRLGKRLRTLREMRRMTQAELGTEVGLSHQQIQKYEAGQSQVRASLAMRFATLFNIDVAQLVSETDIIASGEQYFAQSLRPSARVAEEATQSPDCIDADIVKLVTLFSQIKSPQQRAIVLDLTASLMRP